MNLFNCAAYLRTGLVVSGYFIYVDFWYEECVYIGGMIKIEKKIPIPELKWSGPRPSRVKYPFGQLKIGDSFLIKGDPSKIRHLIYSSLRSYNTTKTTKQQIKITIRSESKGLRVWRIG